MNTVQIIILLFCLFIYLYMFSGIILPALLLSIVGHNYSQDKISSEYDPIQCLYSMKALS